MKAVKALVATAVLSTALLLSTGCGFTQEVREASATVIPVATYQLASSSVSILWLQEILEAFKESKIDEAVAADPTLNRADAVVEIEVENSDGVKEMVDIDEIIDNLKEMIRMNLETAHLLDTLNEAVQANQGWNPIVGEIRNLAQDPEFQALVKAYAELLRKKKGGE